MNIVDLEPLASAIEYLAFSFGLAFIIGKLIEAAGRALSK